MKPLNELSNREKGRLLAELFPEERAPMICAILEEIEYIRQNKSKIHKQWSNGMITATFWFALAEALEETIQRLGYSMKQSNKTFSDHLFFGQGALFTVHCILQYAEREDSDPKFRLAVHILFGEEKDLSISLNDK